MRAARTAKPDAAVGGVVTARAVLAGTWDIHPARHREALQAVAGEHPHGLAGLVADADPVTLYAPTESEPCGNYMGERRGREVASVLMAAATDGGVLDVPGVRDCVVTAIVRPEGRDIACWAPGFVAKQWYPAALLALRHAAVEREVRARIDVDDRGVGYITPAFSPVDGEFHLPATVAMLGALPAHERARILGLSADSRHNWLDHVSTGKDGSALAVALLTGGDPADPGVPGMIAQVMRTRVDFWGGHVERNLVAATTLLAKRSPSMPWDDASRGQVLARACAGGTLADMACGLIAGRRVKPVSWVRAVVVGARTPFVRGMGRALAATTIDRLIATSDPAALEAVAALGVDRRQD